MAIRGREQGEELAPGEKTATIENPDLRPSITIVPGPARVRPQVDDNQR
jgi:hypothetical protein